MRGRSYIPCFIAVWRTNRHACSQRSSGWCAIEITVVRDNELGTQRDVGNSAPVLDCQSNQKDITQLTRECPCAWLRKRRAEGPILMELSGAVCAFQHAGFYRRSILTSVKVL